MKQLLLSFVAAFALNAATFSPTGDNYLVWVAENPDLPASIVLFVGFALVLAYVLFVRAALGTLGWRGLAVWAIGLSLALWVLSDLGAVDLADEPTAVWAVLTILSIVMAVGFSWRQLQRLRLRWRWPRPRRRKDARFLDEV